MKKTYRTHSEEFKKQVLDHALNSSKSISQICREFEISPSQFYSWKKKLLGGAESPRAVGEGANEATKDGPSPLEMADEIRRLRKENAKLQRQQEILKKAALILGQDPQPNMSSSNI